MTNYSVLSLDITLNRMGYNDEDVKDLFSDPFYTLYRTKIGYEWHPSAVGWSQLSLELIVSGTLGGITAGILKQIGTDFYSWVKTSLNKVLNKKNNDFDNSSIKIRFDDKSIIIYLNSKEEIIESLEKIDKIIAHLIHTELHADKYIEVRFEEIKKLKE
jgi:hypothetical protein